MNKLLGVFVSLTDEKNRKVLKNFLPSYGI